MWGKLSFSTAPSKSRPGAPAVLEEPGGGSSIHKMTLPKVPSAALSNLQRADGSASYSWNGYSVIGAVNGPIEVQRKDELPEEAAIDVIVRPAAGVGGIRVYCMYTIHVKC